MNKQRKLLVSLTFLLVWALPQTAYNDIADLRQPVNEQEYMFIQELTAFYQKLDDPDLNFNALKFGMRGYLSLISGNELAVGTPLVIIDFSKSSSAERFFVINLQEQKILFKSLVAHGKNTGYEFANDFSNEHNSFKSSLGFYKTAETYYGKNGLSIKLDGLEKRINDKARARNIVIHAAEYVDESFIKEHGCLGRSFGCPALPFAGFNGVVENIKEGSCLFIYNPCTDYLRNSTLFFNRAYLNSFQTVNIFNP